MNKAAKSVSWHDLHRSYQALRKRIHGLLGLRQMVGLPPQVDISPAQWQSIEGRLKTMEQHLTGELKQAARTHLRDWEKGIKGARYLQHQIGQSEVTLTQAYSFFDTFLDVLTQRHMPTVGRLLKGCDILALDAIRRKHPALSVVEPPLVSLNRGFGASIAREGVKMPGGITNPLGLIEIPYTRLLEKHNLTSILHEAGHEVMVRLGLKATLPTMVKAALSRRGASKEIQEYYALWMSEIGPDFWAFLCSGIAAAGGIREILVLPPSMMYRVSWTDPHPPGWLRVLLNFEWCRQIWGAGIWDNWERDWLALYPLSLAPQENQKILEEAHQQLPSVARALMQTRFQTLSGKPLTGLFDLASIHPERLNQRLITKSVDLKGLRPSAQLAVFRMMKEKQTLPPDALDALMGDWLMNISIS
ncbi:MAG TPA: hypothetical protein PKA00_09990 [Saprospiraceae bacterium]|nr:hypothetical protein [Saprospiraceae bacterium]HMQ83228.1 hypothetical protein [Saprospiraceae bacterium]